MSPRGSTFIIKYNANFRIFFQKSATAVAYCKRGRGNLRVNGRPLELVEPRVLQYKLQEPILLLGKVRKTQNYASAKITLLLDND